MFALGGHTPIYRLLYHIPPFNSVRYPVKFLFLFFFVIAVTSGIGIDRLREGIEKKDMTTKMIIHIVFYSGFIFAALWGYINLFEADVFRFFDAKGFKPDAYNDIYFNLHNIKRFLLFSFVFCVILLVYLRARQKRFIMVVIAFLLTADLFLANYGFYHAASWDWYISRDRFTENLLKSEETERYFVTKKTAKEFEHFIPGRSIMGSPYASLFGLYTIGGSEVMRVTHHDTFLQMLYGVSSIEDAKRFFDVSGVRYVTTSYEVADKEFKLLQSLKSGEKIAYLYEYTSYLGRFLLFTRATFVKDDKTVIEKLQSNTFDARKELLLLGVTSSNVNCLNVAKNKDLHGKVKLLSYKANRFDLEYEADSNAFLYVSDTYYPGWRAYVDGKETKIYRANLAFRAIEVPKGKHTVVFKYVPLSFYLGLCLTIIGILLCIFLVIRDRKTITNHQITITKHQ